MEIKVNNISFSYQDKKIIDNFSFTFCSGEVVAILGPSGCGKSTLLDLILQLIEPSQGEISYSKEFCENTFSAQLRSSLLFPWKTVGENLDIVNSSMDIDSMLEDLALSGYKNYYPRALSAGMNQRVLILRMVLKEALVWVLDEPFNGLDNDTKVKTQDFLKKYKEDKTIIFVTHNLDEVVNFADRAIIWDIDKKGPDVIIEKDDNFKENLLKYMPSCKIL